MNCFMCKGNMEKEDTTFFAEINNCIIVVKKVPSYVCIQCGDVSYSNDVAKKLEEIVDRIKDSKTEIMVVYFGDDHRAA